MNATSISFFVKTADGKRKVAAAMHAGGIRINANTTERASIKRKAFRQSFKVCVRHTGRTLNLPLAVTLFQLSNDGQLFIHLQRRTRLH